VNNVSATTSPLYAVGNYILSAGGTYQFTATTNATSSASVVSWSSDRTNVATVDPSTGLVRGVGNGSAKITARVQRSATTNDYIEVAINFTVVPALTFQNATTNASIGSSVTLDMTQSNPLAIKPIISSLPTTGVMVTSYNAYLSSPTSTSNNYLSVASGTTISITGKASSNSIGTPITVTTVASSSTYTVKITGSFTVYVTGQTAYPTSVSANNSSLTLSVGQTTNLKLTYEPANAINKLITFEYKSGGIVSATVDNNKIDVYVTGSAVGSDTLYICVQRTAGGGNVEPEKYRFPVSVTVTPVTYTIDTNPPTGNLSLIVGSQQQIAAIIGPSYALKDGLTVRWSVTSDPTGTVVSLDAYAGTNITVSATAAGTAFLLTELMRGDSVLDSSTITITVSPAVPT
jgi:uncharacterized protein YjdB